jgi:D-aminopeptidase
LAFATGNHLPNDEPGHYRLTMLRHKTLDKLFAAVIEATEEAILNALCAAQTMTGFKGRTAYALPVEELAGMVKARGR